MNSPQFAHIPSIAEEHNVKESWSRTRETQKPADVWHRLTEFQRMPESHFKLEYLSFELKIILNLCLFFDKSHTFKGILIIFNTNCILLSASIPSESLLLSLKPPSYFYVFCFVPDWDWLRYVVWTWVEGLHTDTWGTYNWLWHW